MCVCYVVPGPVNSLDVFGENSTSFTVSWKSPSTFDKNGIILSYYIIASFTSNGSIARDRRLNVSERVEDDIDYNESVAGLGEILHIHVHVYTVIQENFCVKKFLCVKYLCKKNFAA